MRAVTFQSIQRISSPGTYSRTSANSMPRPRKTDSYWPEKISLTRRRVLISRRWTWAINSRVNMPSSGLRPPSPASPREKANHLCPALAQRQLGEGARRAGAGSLRNLHGREYFRDDIFGGGVFRLGFIREQDPVAQDVGADGFDILRSHIPA